MGYQFSRNIFHFIVLQEVFLAHDFALKRPKERPLGGKWRVHETSWEINCPKNVILALVFVENNVKAKTGLIKTE